MFANKPVSKDGYFDLLVQCGLVCALEEPDVCSQFMQLNSVLKVALVEHQILGGKPNVVTGAMLAAPAVHCKLVKNTAAAVVVLKLAVGGCARLPANGPAAGKLLLGVALNK